jgi:hypothetical protein
MCTITVTTAAGTMAIGLAGFGTRVVGSNKVKSNILLSQNLGTAGRYKRKGSLHSKRLSISAFPAKKSPAEE